MAAPKIFRSSDVGAPVMLGGSGTLISLLDACLVDGYGSTFATGTININNQFGDGDTITIGSAVYTFKPLLTGPPNQLYVNPQANQAADLAKAINATGVALTNYSTGTTASPEVWASYPGSGAIVTLYARKGGTAGNSIPLSKVSAATQTLSGSTLTGGGGTNTKASAGWTKPFTGPTAFAQAVYKQPAGCGFYLQVDDNGPGVALGAEARTFGFETMTAWNTGTGQFPTVAQNVGGAVLRKVLYSQRDTVRQWLLIADDRTFYLFILTNDTTDYIGYTFGDFYSFNAADLYKCLTIGRNTESSAASAQHPFGQAYGAQVGGVPGGGHWLARNFTGIGGSTAFTKHGDSSLVGSPQSNLVGVMMFPNGSDGGLYLSPVRLVDPVVASGSPAFPLNLRGKMRGLWHAPYALTSFADGDTFQGSGELAGRNFIVIKPVLGTSTGVGFVVIETTAWDTSA